MSALSDETSHRRAAVDATNRLPLVNDKLLQIRPCSNQAPLQISDIEYDERTTVRTVFSRTISLMVLDLSDNWTFMWRLHDITLYWMPQNRC